jgi:hypothetical protein
MQAILMALGLTLFSQLADGRYDDLGAGADAAETDAADQTAAPDDSSGAEAGAGVEDVPSQIVIPADTPPPVLADEPALAADGGDDALEPASADGPDFDNPFADMPPGLRGAAPGAAAASAEAASGENASAETGAAAAQSAAAPAEPKPGDLMRAVLATPMTDQLAGVPLSLGSALRDATTRSAQTERAQAYWDLSAAVAQYYLALQEGVELAALRAGVAAPAATWDAATADAAQRVDYTRHVAVAAQLRLHRLMGAAASPSLPLPADSPHCGRYSTRYGEIFAGRPDSAAAHLNDLLPLIHGELLAETRRVAEAHEWLTFVGEHRDPATDGTGLLRSYQLMTERRRAFIETARVYNHQIAAYAELATPEQIGPERLVAMLIRVSTNSAGGAAEDADAGVQPASAADGAADSDPQNPGSSKTSPGARENRPRTAWRPFDRLRNRERSIVTARRKLFRPNRERD